MEQARKRVSSWRRRGRASLDAQGQLILAPKPSPALSHKLRAAYHWICEKAIFSPIQDIHVGPPQRLHHGELRLELPREPGYSSFLLLPILTLLTSRTLLFVGAPGRGKTSVATLMGLLAGYDLQEMRRAIQHGHPQLTLADLLGSPLPGDLVKAQSTQDIRVSWRSWIQKRVKIIDEYNRIPTKTQSALLSLLSEGYAQMYEQTIESGASAWYLTANDDLGGGTFPVIEALKDRIDVVVRTAPFHGRFLEHLEARIREDRSPEALLPQELLLSPQELQQLQAEVRAVPVPPELQRLLGFFMGQLDFCRQASAQLEFMNKDTLHLSGRKLAHVCNEDCPLDKQENLCTQSENGVSTRAYQALLHYAKALAYFRGSSQVSLDDLRALVPWVLHQRLQPNPHSAFFQKAEHQLFAVDKASWLAQLFDRALEQHHAYAASHERVQALLEQSADAAKLSRKQLRERRAEVQKQLQQLLQEHELNGPVHGDLLTLKMLYSRYLQREAEA